ncbi:MAG: hypothetical protein AAFP03_02555 [Cyanobacteria bacterium J06598_3]
MVQKKWKQCSSWLSALFPQALPNSRSAAYDQWRHQFVGARLRLGTWLAIAAQLFLLATEIFLETPLTRLSEQASFYISFAEVTEDFQAMAISIVCLLVFQQLLKHAKLKHAPIKLLPIFTLIVLVVGSGLYQLSVIQQLDSDVVIDIAIVFWCQAIVVPVQWRSHLLAQGLSLVWIFGVWAIALVGQSGSASLLPALLDMSWGGLYALLVMVSTNFMVRHSEQQIWREFSLREQIEHSLQTVSEDLQRPILDNQQLLKTLPSSTATTSADSPSIHIPSQTVQQLLDNSDCQLSLLNQLLATAEYHD